MTVYFSLIVPCGHQLLSWIRESSRLYVWKQFLSLTYTASDRDPGLTGSHALNSAWGSRPWGADARPHVVGAAYGFPLFRRMYYQSEFWEFSQSCYKAPHPKWHITEVFPENTWLEGTEGQTKTSKPTCSPTVISPRQNEKISESERSFQTKIVFQNIKPFLFLWNILKPIFCNHSIYKTA